MSWGAGTRMAESVLATASFGPLAHEVEEGRGEGASACSPLTLLSLMRRAPPSPTIVGEGIPVAR
jgi:hypothetical protein